MLTHINLLYLKHMRLLDIQTKDQVRIVFCHMNEMKKEIAIVVIYLRLEHVAIVWPLTERKT